VALGYCVVNWLVPGAGYLLVRDWARGIGIMVLINGVFLLGLVFDGYMAIPAMSPRDPSFNIFMALTFIVQLWHGGGVLAVFGAESMGGPLAALLVRDPGGAYSDLGSFHFAVAGGLNYFATVRLYDLIRPMTAGEEGQKSDTPNRTTNRVESGPTDHHGSSVGSDGGSGGGD